MEISATFPSFRKCWMEMNLAGIFFFFQLISIYLTRSATLAIRLWCGVDTAANGNSLNRRRTIRNNACTQEKIIEFLSILHYNESLDISKYWVLRTLQSMGNYLVGAESMGQSARGRESFIILEAKEDTVVVEASVNADIHIYLLCGFISGAQNPETLHYQIKEWMQTAINSVS